MQFKLHNPFYFALSSALCILLVPSATNAVISGQVADPAQSATLIISNNAGGGCSATAIGARAVITAAHCVPSLDDKTETAASVRTHSGELKALRCIRHPLHNERREADVALCETATELDGPIARASLELPHLAIGSTVRFFGYGCRDVGGTDRAFGVLATGVAKLTSSAPIVSDGLAWLETSGAAICYGDAGAGVYLDSPNKPSLIAVAALGDMAKRSFSPLLGVPAIAKWIREWDITHQNLICGVHSETGCQHQVGQDQNVAAFSAVIAAPAEQRLTTLAKNDSAPSSKPVLHVQAFANETMRLLVRRTCGDVADSYFSELSKVAQTEHVPQDVDAKIQAGTLISILPCPPNLETPPFIERDLTDETRKFQTWDWFREALKIQKDRWKYFTPSKEDPNAPNFFDTFRRLNQSADPQFDPANPSKTTLKKIRLPLAPGTVQPSVSPAVNYVPGGVQPVFSISPPPDQCGRNDSTTNYPFDVLALLRVMGREKYSPEKVTVLVADSGLTGVATGPFDQTTLPDFDHANFAQHVRPVIFPEGGLDWSHGTAVASLVLGGPMFFSTASATTKGGLVQLKIEQIYHVTSLAGQSFIGPAEGIFASMMVKNPNVAIVNLSIESNRVLDEFAKYLQDIGGPLFVVAAGNDRTKLIANVSKVFPAMMVSRNLIAVGAWDPLGKKLAGFSNSGLPYVEIAAQGCYVPVWLPTPDHGWAVNEMSGTSMAAPIVSFTAALIRAYWPSAGAPDIKRRLLGSADIEPELIGKIYDGRLLDPVKALAIREDVVETIDEDKDDMKKKGQRLFGAMRILKDGGPVSDDNPLTLTCADGEEPVQVNSLIKIVPAFPTRHDRFTLRVYAMPGQGEDRLMQELDCEDPGNLVIEITESESRQKHNLILGQIADIVPRSIH